MVRYRELVESIDKRKIKDLLDANFTYEGNCVIDNRGYVTIYGYCRYSGRSQDGILPDRLPVNFARTKDFDCYDKHLKALDGCPEIVEGDFNCQDNELVSLKGGPRWVLSDYFCQHNQLKSLIGSPDYVGERLNCFGNKLESLEGLADVYAISLNYGYNLPLLRLLKVGVFGLLGNDEVADILRKHDGKQNFRANIIACQKELIDAGYEGNASW